MKIFAFNRCIYNILCVVSLLSLFSCRSLFHASAGKTGRDIVVLYDNDVHCGIDGYSRLAGLRDAIADTAFVAVVSSGDFLQGGTSGAISKGQYIVDIMRNVRYDAIGLGNHEFDYKFPRMFELLDDFKPNITCVNLTQMDGQLVYAPYVIKTFGKQKVAFVGTVTPTTLDTEEYAFFDEAGHQLYDLCPEQVYQRVQKAVDEARSKGADHVVVLSHLGEDHNRMNVDSHGLVAYTTGIDAVLDGHTHNVVPGITLNNRDGHPVLVTQTGTKFANIGKLLLRKGQLPVAQLIPTSEVEVNSSIVQHTIDSINTLASQLTSRPICDSEVDIVILDDQGLQLVRRAETNAGDIVTDAYRHLTGADFAITNGGGIRTQLKAGKLTYGDVVSLLPYDNYVSVVEITGSQLLTLLNACTQFLPALNGDFPQVSGLQFTIDMSRDSLHRVTSLKTLDSKSGTYIPVDPSRTYRLATIDYCITGGGLQGLLKTANVIQPNLMVYNECLIKYITEVLNGHIGQQYAAPQGRILIK